MQGGNRLFLSQWPTLTVKGATARINTFIKRRPPFNLSHASTSIGDAIAFSIQPRCFRHRNHVGARFAKQRCNLLLELPQTQLTLDMLL